MRENGTATSIGTIKSVDKSPMVSARCHAGSCTSTVLTRCRTNVAAVRAAHAAGSHARAPSPRSTGSHKTMAVNP